MSITISRGVSAPAQYVDQTTREVRARLIEPATFTRQSAYDALWDAWQPCQIADWDDESADPIEHETFRIAYRLIEALPIGCPLPTVSAEPDGHLSFEWYKHPRRLLSVSISGNGTLYWAALVGSEDSRGSCQFFDEFPSTLLRWVGRVYAT